MIVVNMSLGELPLPNPSFASFYLLDKFEFFKARDIQSTALKQIKRIKGCSKETTMLGTVFVNMGNIIPLSQVVMLTCITLEVDLTATALFV